MSARDHFFALADALAAEALPGETLLLNWAGEDGDFARFSRARIRQAGAVRQRTVSLEAVADRRAAAIDVDCAGGADDLATLRAALATLRALRPALPPDPHLLLAAAPLRLERCDPAGDADAGAIAAEIARQAGDLDLAGILACGRIERGFASSTGARCWHEVAMTHLDASCYAADGQAVKFVLAGPRFAPAALADELAAVRTRLAALAQPRRELPPGGYRALLEPAALVDLLQMLSWGGFSLKARRTRTSPLLRLEEGARLSPLVELAEDGAGGLAPRFTSRGFAKAERVTLIRAGALGDALVGPRSAAEFGVPANAGDEYPESLALAPGDLPRADALHRLGTGLWIGNLWYCNWSDRSAGRITGMTRFATLWVEDGVPRGPVAPLRFDDTVESLLGDALEALTRERAVLPSASTYGGRGTAQAVLPGALLARMRFTL